MILQVVRKSSRQRQIFLDDDEVTLTNEKGEPLAHIVFDKEDRELAIVTEKGYAPRIGHSIDSRIVKISVDRK